MHRRETPPPHFKQMADYFTTSQLQLTRNYLDGDFNDVVFNSKHDPLTGIDTGSGNDHLTGNDMWSPAPECTYTSEPGGNDPIVHHIGGTSGPGGTSFLTEENGKAIVHPSFQPEADGYTEVEWTYLTENLGGTAGPGGTTYMTGVDHLGQFGHDADNFTNFAMPVGDFI